MPLINGNTTNLYKYHIDNTITLNKLDQTRKVALKKILSKTENESNTTKTLINLAEKLYEKGYSGIDLTDYIINHWKKLENSENKYRILLFNRK